MFTKIAGIAAIAAAALTISLTGTTTAAHAQSAGMKDADDIAHGVDLRSVHVQNTDTFLRVTTTHTNLRRDPKTGAAGAVYLDTNPKDKGPELVFVSGYFSGTDYQLLKTEGFRSSQWGDPVQANSSLHLDYVNEKVIMRLSRAAVGADDVRVAVRVAGLRNDGTPVVDWLRKPRSFTAWIERG